MIGATCVTLLPGSRLQEVTRMLPIFLNTMKLLKDDLPELMAVIPVAPNKYVEDYISRVVHQCPVPSVLIPGGLPSMKYDASSVRPLNLLSCTIDSSLFLILVRRHRVPRPTGFMISCRSSS